MSICVPLSCSELTPHHLSDLCGHYNCEVQSSHAWSNTIACIPPWRDAMLPLTILCNKPSTAELSWAWLVLGQQTTLGKLPLEVLFIRGQGRNQLPSNTLVFGLRISGRIFFGSEYVWQSYRTTSGHMFWIDICTVAYNKTAIKHTKNIGAGIHYDLLCMQNILSVPFTFSWPHRVRGRLQWLQLKSLKHFNGHVYSQTSTHMWSSTGAGVRCCLT